MTRMLLSLPCAAQVSLVRDSEARAVVVRADKPTSVARYAVKELVRHVEKATGITLKVVPESEAPVGLHTRVYVGQTEAARRHGIEPERLRREAFTMRSIGNDLFIVGREDNGDPLRQDNAKLARNLTAVYGGTEAVPADRLEKAKGAPRELVKFRKDHEHTYFSDLLHVTSFWERPRTNLDALVNMLSEK